MSHLKTSVARVSAVRHFLALMALTLTFGVGLASGGNTAFASGPAPQNDVPEILVPHNSAVIDNGVIQLGVRDQGQLNIPVAGVASLQDGTTAVGLRYWGNATPPGDILPPSEATAPGCLCEGWGAADFTTGITGYANVSVDGVVNLVGGPLVVTGSGTAGFGSTGDSAVSTVVIEDFANNPFMRVVHDFRPSPATPNLYEVQVEITNLSGAPIEPRYRRVMDWDIAPTTFSELVTVRGFDDVAPFGDGIGGAANLIFVSDDGFQSANPLAPTSILNFSGNAEHNGPDDHGASFDFAFDTLAPGDSVRFKIFYGATSNEPDADAAVAAVAAEASSYGQPELDGEIIGYTIDCLVEGFGGEGDILAAGAPGGFDGGMVYDLCAGGDTLDTDAVAYFLCDFGGECSETGGPYTAAELCDVLFEGAEAGGSSICSGEPPVFDVDLATAYLCDYYDYDVNCSPIFASSTVFGEPNTFIFAFSGIGGDPLANPALTPAEAINIVGQSHTVSATLVDDFNAPLPGVEIGFEVTAGPNAGVSGVAITDASGLAEFDYVGAAPGEDTILATAVVDGDILVSNPASKIWLMPGIDISKQDEGPDSRLFPSGADVVFDIWVTNTGETDLFDVTVSDPLVADCDNVIGFMAPGDSVHYTCTDLVVAASYTNVATASGTPGLGAPSLLGPVDDSDESSVEIESAAVPGVINADLRLTAVTPRFVPGANPVFELTVTWENVGSDTYSDVFFNVMILSGPACTCEVLDPHTGPDGVGANVPIDVGPDLLWTPGESVTKTFNIGTTSIAPLSFFGDVWGTP